MLWAAMDDACFNDAAGIFWRLIIFFKVLPLFPLIAYVLHARFLGPACSLMRARLQVYVAITTLGAVAGICGAAREFAAPATDPGYQPVV